MIAEEGVSDSDKLVAMMRRYLRPCPTVREIQLRLIVTNADGDPAAIDGSPATTFEHVVDLRGDDFATEESIEHVYLSVAASAALPLLFAPVSLRVGPRAIRAFDGGLLNDAPVGLALSDAPEISRVFIVVPFPRVAIERPKLRGRALASHVFDMLVLERLFRDLRSVVRTNGLLLQLQALIPDAAQRAAVLEALGWAERRPVEIVEIRPATALPGDAFSGFWSRDLRERYVRAGVEAAERVLSDLA